MVIDLTDQNFEQEVIKSSLPVIVDMGAPWCGPCRALEPMVEKLADEFADRVKVCRLNVDDNPNTAKEYGVRSIPFIAFFKGGKKVDETIGSVPADVLRPKMEALL